MTRQTAAFSRLAIASFLVFGAMSAQDLSKYRTFQLGTDLPAVTAQAGVDAAQVKTIESRPAVIQELDWRPIPSGLSQPEPVDDVVLSFFNGVLYRIAVNYDRHDTEGLTADDFIETLSAGYGIAERPTVPPVAARETYSGAGIVVARWQDSQFRFELTRASFGAAFSLVGVLKSVEAPARASIEEAARLDVQEAPQRDAERLAGERVAEQARLDKARLVNKANFRP